MAQVTVKINGYAYMVGCEDGQEAHLLAMAGEVDRRIESIKALGGQSGEARLLMLAALLMADELHDLRAGHAPTAGTGAADPELAQKLHRLAMRAEEIAGEMEQPG